MSPVSAARLCPGRLALVGASFLWVADMVALSMTPQERARKIQRIVLQRVQRDASQAAVAAAMGVSESTVSRLLSEHLDKLAAVLAHAGLKVVPVERVCVDPSMYEAMTRIATRAMADVETAQRLVWGEE